jgi:hypothetical protein
MLQACFGVRRLDAVLLSGQLAEELKKRRPAAALQISIALRRNSLKEQALRYLEGRYRGFPDGPPGCAYLTVLQAVIPREMGICSGDIAQGKQICYIEILEQIAGFMAAFSYMIFQ